MLSGFPMLGEELVQAGLRHLGDACEDGSSDESSRRGAAAIPGTGGIKSDALGSRTRLSYGATI